MTTPQEAALAEGAHEQQLLPTFSVGLRPDQLTATELEKKLPNRGFIVMVEHWPDRGDAAIEVTSFDSREDVTIIGSDEDGMATSAKVERAGVLEAIVVGDGQAVDGSFATPSKKIRVSGASIDDLGDDLLFVTPKEPVLMLRGSDYARDIPYLKSELADETYGSTILTHIIPASDANVFCDELAGAIGLDGVSAGLFADSLRSRIAQLDGLRIRDVRRQVMKLEIGQSLERAKYTEGLGAVALQLKGVRQELAAREAETAAQIAARDEKLAKTNEGLRQYRGQRVIRWLEKLGIIRWGALESSQPDLAVAE